MNSQRGAQRKQAASQPKLLHIIPQDGIGGVEKAAHSSANSDRDNVHLLFLASKGQGFFKADGLNNIDYATGVGTLSPGSALFALRRARQLDPDIILFSLWKSVFAFLLLRIMLRKPVFVLFLHIDCSMHWADRFSTWLMHKFADEVWADSENSAARRIGFSRNGRQRRVISFIVERSEGAIRQEPAARFIFWGRLTEQKRVDRAISLFAEIAQRADHPSFLIVGPDRGVQSDLENQVRELKLDDRIRFLGPKSPAEIRSLAAEASFYLQLSESEGMAMSVTEAMQMGLVPVVTPVGAIKDYCRDGENAVIFTDMENTAGRIDTLLGEAGRYRKMSGSAIAQWADAPLYCDDLLAAAQESIDKRAGVAAGNNSD
jgi:glycosyltransferase involved in cell wall biosynthesis